MSLEAKSQPQQGVLLGILLVIVSGSLLAIMDAVSKYLTGSFQPVQVVWSRYFFHAIIVISYLLLTHSRAVFKSNRLGLQMRRSAALFGATAAMYTSLKYLPLADAASVQFFAPVLVTVFSGLFLAEKIGFRRYGAVLMAFIGVLIVVQPGADFKLPMLLPLITAFLLAIFLIQTRALRGVDDDYTTLFYSTLFGVVVLIVIVPFFWVQPTFTQFLIMCVQGSLGAIGHLLLIKGFKYAPASLLSPFLYSQLLMSVILSVSYFGDPLTVGIFAGATLIVGSGVYIWHREVYLAEHKR